MPLQLTFTTELSSVQMYESCRLIPLATPEHERPTLPFMNEECALEQAADSIAFLVELVFDVLKESDEKSPRMQNAIDTNVHEELRRTCYNIRGVSLYLNFLTMIDITYGLETIATALRNDKGDAGTLLPLRQGYFNRIVQGFHRVELYLNRLAPLIPPSVLGFIDH